MPLVPAICSSCGAQLEVDSTQEAAVCKYCNTPFVTEKAINNYSIKNSVVHIHAEMKDKKEFEIVAGDLVKYNGEQFELTVPDNIKRIGSHCFDDSAIERIVLPEGLTEIDSFAFAKCSVLKSVKLPSTLKKICCSAFVSCTLLEEIVLPDSVTVCENSAFEECRSLKRVTLSSKLTSISSDMFRECRSLESITIHEGVRTIGSKAFYGCRSLKSVSFPDSLEYIGQNAFSDCESLSSVAISNKLHQQSRQSFLNTPWQKYIWKSQGRCPECGGRYFFGFCTNCRSKRP
ncbi:MAG: leucine-rich repeat domain-containing protein [Oscillospiraceae bacterium]